MAWVAEGHGGDQFAILAACATRTSRIRLGTSISSVFVRTAPTIAMAASTIADISGGRFILGLGRATRCRSNPSTASRTRKPLTRTRETVAIVRELIREGRVRFEGETIRIRISNLVVHAAAPGGADLPVGRVPERGRTVRRSRRRHHPDAQHIAHGRAVRVQLAEGARNAGRDPAQIEVTSLLPTSVGDTRDAALAALRPGIAFYAGFSRATTG